MQPSYFCDIVISLLICYFQFSYSVTPCSHDGAITDYLLCGICNWWQHWQCIRNKANIHNGWGLYGWCDIGVFTICIKTKRFEYIESKVCKVRFFLSNIIFTLNAYRYGCCCLIHNNNSVSGPTSSPSI